MSPETHTTESSGHTIFTVENLTRKRILATRILSARDSATRRRGLLDATELSDDSGLWLNPCEAIHTFGMQIPLDALFLDARFCIRKISANLKPNRIAFCLPAASVLEVKAGLASSTGTECGDQLVFHRRMQPTGAPSLRR